MQISPELRDSLLDDPMVATGVRQNAKNLLRAAVLLNLQHRKLGRETSPLSEERDEIAARLTLFSLPANYDDYTHPSDVE
jgi:hypothetical protein